MVFQQYFSYVISWQSVLLVEETGVPGENHVKYVNYSDSLSKLASSYSLQMCFRLNLLQKEIQIKKISYFYLDTHCNISNSKGVASDGSLCIKVAKTTIQ
jgi:hypothetical protein